jgi:hypothetical protein
MWALLFSSSLYSQIAAAVEPSVKVRLTEEGLQLIANEIKKSAFADLANIPIPNQTGGFLALRYAAKGIKVDGKFADIKLIPRDNYLELAVKIQDLKINVSEFSLTEYLPIPWITRCRNLELKTGFEDPITAELGINTQVVGGQVKFEFQKIKFRNIRQAYSVRGPSSCSMPLPLGPILEAFVHEFLLHAEPVLEVALKIEMIKAENKIGKAVSDALLAKREISIPEIIGVPATTLDISLRPLSFGYDPGGVDFSFYVDVKRKLQALPTGALISAKGFLTRDVLASAAIDANFINRLLAEVLPTGTSEIEVDNDLIPGIEEILTTSFVSSFIPDLGTVSTDSDKVRLRLQLKSAPILAAVPATQAVAVNVQDLVLTFMISQNGHWLDYYIFNFKFSGNFGAKITEDHMFQIKAFRKINYDFSGKWAPGYEPANPTMDAETLRLTIDSVFDSLYEQPSMYELELPVFSLGKDGITVASPSVTGNYLGLDLIKVSQP